MSSFFQASVSFVAAIAVVTAILLVVGCYDNQPPKPLAQYARVSY